MTHQVLLLCCVVAFTVVPAISEYDDSYSSYYLVSCKDLPTSPDCVWVCEDLPTDRPDCVWQKGEGRSSLRRRHLQSSVKGPCMGLKFSETCPTVPALNPAMSKLNGLSFFARDWVQYTCCQIVKAPMREIISAIWMWLQVCTKAMAMATDNFYHQDSMWDWGTNATAKIGGPLLNMQRYCPQELEGGRLSEWVVITFFPVMEDFNPNFKSFDSAATCKAPTEKVPVADSGDVSVIYSRPVVGGAFGHLAMILHDDQDLKLPPPLDTQHFVSFSTVGNTVGTMITGTKAAHVGFGQNLASVTAIVTIHNADVAAMQREWQKIKENGQMFDLLDWNCARTVMEILHAGFPDCVLPLEQLWTPEQAFKFTKKVASIMNDDDDDQQLPLEQVHARQIEKETHTDGQNLIGVPVATLIASVLGSVFGTFVIALVVATAVICHIHQKAHSTLESNLANLLIGAVHDHASPFKMQTNTKTNTKTNSVVPLGPSQMASAGVVRQMDSDKNGGTNKEEFMVWATQHGMPKSQAHLLWKDLDKNHNSEISRDEWTNFIDERPNLRWLIKRLKSVANSKPDV